MRKINISCRLLVINILGMSILAFLFGNSSCRTKKETEAALKKKYGVHYIAFDLGKMTTTQKRETAKHHQNMLALIDEIKEELAALRIQQWAKSSASESNLLAIDAALRLTEHLRELECGDFLIRSDESNILVFGQKFYETWNREMKLYGTRINEKSIPTLEEISADTFAGELTQITEGDWKGALQDKSGKIIIPGIKYLELKICPRGRSPADSAKRSLFLKYEIQMQMKGEKAILNATALDEELIAALKHIREEKLQAVEIAISYLNYCLEMPDFKKIKLTPTDKLILGTIRHQADLLKDIANEEVEIQNPSKGTYIETGISTFNGWAKGIVSKGVRIGIMPFGRPLEKWPQKATLITRGTLEGFGSGSLTGFCKEEKGGVFLPGAVFFKWKILPYVIEDLSNVDPKYRVAIVDWLETTTEQSFGMDQKKWKEWYKKTGRYQYKITGEE